MEAIAVAAWVDGALVHPERAVVSAFDHGVTVGDGVFETLLVHHGVPFALRRHLERLERSAATLGLEVPGREVLARAVAEVVGEVVAASELAQARLRLTVTGGPAPLGSGRGAAGPTVIVAAGALEPLPPTVDVVVVPWTRNERSALAGAKTTSYAENVVALAHARGRGAGEAVFANTRGELCEGTGSNVVVGVDGRLVTPPLSSGCLAGVTRALVLERCQVEEAVLPVGALAAAEEAFLTSTTRGVQPIASVDGRPLARAPGPLTAAAAAGFSDLLASDPDP
ncbi:MAG: aminotransferase class IV [Actinomycetota bacterium]|jgi:branched-chain amino acid aminotransferase|nr:aminotransferase class IV [Actinomycetota bacterium]